MEPDLPAVASGAAHDAGGLDPGLLGDFLVTVAEAAASGRRVSPRRLEAYGERGALAAAEGVPLRALVDLYLSASWRLWAELPVVRGGTGPQVAAAGLAVLRAADDAVAALAEGYQLARNELARRQEAERREVFEALLAGGLRAAEVLGRAAGLGLDLAGRHAVLVGRAPGGLRQASAPLLGRVERALAGRYGDAAPLLSVHEDQLVCVFAAPDDAAVDLVRARVSALLGAPWQVAVGRARAGAESVRASYEQARDTLELAARLGLAAPVVDPADLAVYRVLLRDREAILELIATVLGPLQQARGGPDLLRTLETYYATGANATETARRLHLSVRAVTYRLARAQQLLGRDPADPAARLSLHAAVLGARLLGWPDTTG